MAINRENLYFEIMKISIITRPYNLQLQLTVAINHENLYYHTALQAVHLTWNKGKDSFI